MAKTKTNDAQSTKVITGKVRLAFVQVFKPGQNDNGEDVYSVMAFWPKEDNEAVGVKQFAAAIQNVYAVEKSKKLARADGSPTPMNMLKLPIKDADVDTNNEGLTLAEKYPEFAGCMYMNLNSKTPPGVIGRDKEVIREEDNLIYSGCYARLSINFYAYAQRGNKGITAGLNNIQYWGKGEYMGGRASAESDFDVLDDEPASMDEEDAQDYGRKSKTNLEKETAADNVPDWMK